MLVWDRYGFHKKHAGTHYAKLVFLHLIGSAGDILHSTASVAQNVDASSGICGSCSAFRCVQDVKRRRTIFHARVGPVRIPQKGLRDTLHRTCIFASGGVSGSCSCSSASGTQNVDALFFMLGWERYGFHKKRARKRYTKLVFLHAVGSAGHVVHSNASGTSNNEALFFYAQVGLVRIPQKGIGKHCAFRCVRYGLHKKHAETCYGELVFSHPVGSVGHVVHSGASTA
jgi:hypothetical protein